MKKINFHVNKAFTLEELKDLEKSIKDSVIKHQGEKGYIDTTDPRKEETFASTYIYDSKTGEVDSSVMRVEAVRVYEGRLQILLTDKIWQYENMDEHVERMIGDWEDVSLDNKNLNYEGTLTYMAFYIEDYC